VEVDVARRVDQVQHVVEPVGRAVAHAHGLRLDRDAALALEVHRVEDLVAAITLRHAAREIEQAIRERRLAVVDVRDDREVADALAGKAQDLPRSSSALK
jgi:hypothetical protein